MKIFLLKSCIGIGLLFVIAQQVDVFANSASIDNSFDVGDPIGFNDRTTSITKQNDGKILVGGKFTAYRGILVPHLVRLNLDGSLDTNFNFTYPFDPSFDINYYTNVYTTIQNDGKIIVGIWVENGYNKVMRLNNNGSVDNSFNDGNGFIGNPQSSNISTVAVQSDGKVLVGGDQLQSFNGQEVRGLIRLNADGTRDTSFDPGVRSESLKCNKISIQNDGKIIISNDMGGMVYIGGSHDIARLNTDGTEDTGFIVPSYDGDGVPIGGLGNYYQINDFTIQNDGKIIIVGNIQDFAGNSLNILRLNTDGTLDDTFSGGISLDYVPLKVRIKDDGKIILFGTMYDNIYYTSEDTIIQLNSDGSINNSFSQLPIIDYNQLSELSMNIQSDGKILLGGYMIRLNTDGTVDTTFNQGNGLNNNVSAIGLQNDGKVVIGGKFTTYKGIPVSNIISLNADGTLDTGFTSNILGTIETINTQNDRKVIVNYYSGSDNSIIRLNTDGSIDNSFNSGTGFDNAVKTAVIQSDGKIIVGGWFKKYKGVTSQNIIRLKTDGSKDTGFNIPFTWIYDGSSVDRITDIKIQSDGKTIIAGSFQTVGGSSSKRIARLVASGYYDNTFKVGSGFNKSPQTLGIQSDGKIIVGGDFTNYSGTTVNRIVRLNTGGTIDVSFVIGSGFDDIVKQITVQDNGKIVVAGRFRNYNGSVANGIIGLNSDGSIDTGFVTGIGLDMSRGSRYNDDSVLRIQSGGKIFLGGGFTSFNGKAAGFLTSFYGNSPVVDLPASTDTGVVAAAFLAKGYTQSNGDLIGTTPISLANTNGDIPVDLTVQNTNVTVALDANTQLKQADATTPYDGLLSVPTTKTISSVNDEPVISSFKVGSSSESIKLIGGVATLSLPAPGQAIGSIVQVYYSEDNGVSWYPQTQTVVIDKNGQPYVEFTTNHFTDFAVTIPQGTYTGSFVINSAAASTTSQNVSLGISMNPTPAQMRFSNDNTFRSPWEAYSTTKAWTLSAGTGTKTVYAQFDTNSNNISDININDTIVYDTEVSGGGASAGGLDIHATLGISTGTISFYKDLTGGNHANTMDIGTYAASFADISASSASDHRFEIYDMLGLAFTVTMQSSDLVASNGTIPAANIGYQGSAWSGVGKFLTAAPVGAVDIGSNPVTFVSRNDNSGVSKYHQDIQLNVHVPAAQAPGAYAGMLTFTY